MDRQLGFGQLRRDVVEERRWLARLSESKRKNLLQFLRRKEFRIVAAALDDLLPYIGPWPSLLNVPKWVASHVRINVSRNVA